MSLYCGRTEEEWGKLSTEQQVEELEKAFNKCFSKNKVKEVIDENSFVVAMIFDSFNGQTINPRSQWPITLINTSIRDHLIGKKVGDTINFGVLNTYKILSIVSMYKN